MFKIDGNVDVTIVEAYVSEATFDAQPGEVNNRNEIVQVMYDVCLLLQDKDGNTDTWHGEISSRTGIGTKAHLYRLDLTLETLREIGFNVNSIAELEAQFAAAQDGTIAIPNLVNMQATAWVAKSDKVDRNGNPYYNIKGLYKLGSGNGGGKKLTMAELMAKRGQAAPAPQGYQQQPQTAPQHQSAPASYPAQQPPQNPASTAPAPAQWTQNAAPQAYPPQTYGEQTPPPNRPAMPQGGGQSAPGTPGAQNCPY